ncbi:hypothetical protein AQ490_18010 [Wenjunlia vitaminophila]|uniref:Rieske domain-containing protein n=1 Tax=Wenjunlia vitaminophila TaxID=76728 RepID=A0A0T6LWA6_WENVI|nr:hypothetical protein AQ490_18010 [Wenjunlia vitaminophila]
MVEAAGEDEVRVRVGEREFLVSAACPHRRGRLVFARVNEARLRITCPLHHSSFDLLTGAALSGPTERPLCVREVTGDQPPR